MLIDDIHRYAFKSAEERIKQTYTAGNQTPSVVWLARRRNSKRQRITLRYQNFTFFFSFANPISN